MAAKKKIVDMLDAVSPRRKIAYARELSLEAPIKSSAFIKEFLNEGASFESSGAMDAVPYLVALNGLRPELWYWQDDERDHALTVLSRMTYEPSYSKRTPSTIDLDEAFVNSGVQARQHKKLLWAALKRIALFSHYREERAMTVLAVLMKLAARDQQNDVLLWGMGYLAALSKDGPDDKVLYVARCVRRKCKHVSDAGVRCSVIDLCDALLNQDGSKK